MRSYTNKKFEKCFSKLPKKIQWVEIKRGDDSFYVVNVPALRERFDVEVEEEDGLYIANVPALQGYHTQA